MFSVLNANYAVVRYGSETLVASVIGNDVTVMKVHELPQDFCQCACQGGMLRRNKQTLVQLAGSAAIYRRGIVFEPGGPLDVPDDMLNLWRGFGIEPKQGDWSLLRNHFLMSSAPGADAL